MRLELLHSHSLPACFAGCHECLKVSLVIVTKDQTLSLQLSQVMSALCVNVLCKQKNHTW